MYKLKEFRDEMEDSADFENKAVNLVNKFITDNNINEWYVESHYVVRYEQSNEDRTYILIRYEEDAQ
ncbi:hypothetical protein RSA37_11770 [Mammaliicoccus sciuri]|uniref:hypothetical protein n=1 Tax=Mammaliicoccus sciuri TaxID=1296 RepID=UPI00073451E8|nr:hypothetical protein [Mammaliicoccus sciuri]KTT82708.1 hypothetical protein NS1R_12030 [Mammaliicoccus sciuri]KTT88235.1 hypothetical protein NS112_09460 [Mammaliicoccus sciuri]KTT89778.1 hypothetical protein NS36R_07985 [Mammaliicoccus sciuri]KTT94170.1 hypothetical protein NS44R_08400 [Mammaliicoccus sciuri]KTW10724.1 hypothetical protein RSA37_11770 [Mammaliicoccus sciuri]